MVIILLGVVATYVLSRLVGSSDEGVGTRKRLATAAEALDAFAGASSRLPCPANPAVDDGLELRDAINPAACQFPEGTLPWRTIGLKREDAYDAWGRKISYRVYTGNRGSLVQDDGASMVYCDTTPTGGTGTEPGTGLCKGRPPLGAVSERNTSPSDFLSNKGFTLNDQGNAHNSSVAYVLISHGATGLGGYTVSGARLDLPAGDERNNTRDAGPFTIKAFSDADTAATSGQHFDDLMVYRTVADLVRKANLAARDWFDPPAVPPPTVFNEDNVRQAGGTTANIAGGGVGASSLTFAGATVTGIGSSSTPTELGFGDGGGGSGQGGLGVGTGSDFMIQSSANELLRIEFTEPFTKFGLTLNDFGVYGSGFFEIVELRFYSGSTQVGGSLFGFCNTASALSSFTFDVGAEYNRVDIVPVDSFNIFDGSRGITAFLVSEIKACKASETTCRTALDDPANTFNTRCS